MSGNSYYDDDMSEEDYERVMEHMYELECELEEPHDARTDQLIREELEDLSSAMLFEPVVKTVSTLVSATMCLGIGRIVAIWSPSLQALRAMSTRRKRMSRLI